ncbi:SulP family inorganic anion transporter [Massilia sp. YIM B02443]|uniref:SulP family inorganic anion transporter n=1 Tax=Massilia sp. YIM B02443 TaxID=3050127 RepID=UPI0025B6CDC6|nr:sulfate permease [Massilia sp. YIM B02443]MDN4039782.1 sulfate permease [Massilia sp. YIM B02443]
MLQWLRQYRRAALPGDISAGIVVAMMMIPQGMAYALVAGLPPVVGIYASIFPPLLYALFGTSSTQSVGPMAIISLMTASTLAPLAAPGSALYGVLAAQLALLSGVVLLVCGLLRIGFLANFFSRPVMSGFTIGSALVIAWGQLRPLVGGAPTAPHLPSALLGLGSLALLVAARQYLAPLLRALRVKPVAADIGAKLAPMFVVLGATALVPLLGLAGRGVAITGAVPSGLPGLNLATSADHWQALLQPALLIGFMVFLISMSGAQALALKRGGEKLASNSELVGLGAANIGSALSGGFPVTGSISRSAVNFAAGANTQLASIITAGLLALALVAPTGWLALLPLPTLAATIIVAVLGMLDLSTLRTAWRYDRADAAALLATAGGVLALGVEAGVVVGVALSMGALIWRASRPHIAVLGRIHGTEHFRNIDRYSAETTPGLLMMRVDAGLFFGNVEAVNERIDEELLDHAGTRHLVLVLSAVNAIDTSALFGLGELNASLRQRGVVLHLAEVKGPVMDRLKDSDLLQALSGQVFLSAAMAWDRLAGSAAAGTPAAGTPAAGSPAAGTPVAGGSPEQAV